MKIFLTENLESEKGCAIRRTFRMEHIAKKQHIKLGLYLWRREYPGGVIAFKGSSHTIASNSVGFWLRQKRPHPQPLEKVDQTFLFCVTLCLLLLIYIPFDD